MGQERLYEGIVEPGTIIKVRGRFLQLKTAHPITVPESFINDASKCCVTDDPCCWVDRHEVGL